MIWGVRVSKFGWCITGHHQSCPVKTLSGAVCACICHSQTHDNTEPPNALRKRKEETILERQEIVPVDSTHSVKSETVSFAIDGETYEVDLNSSQASVLRDALAPYVAAARPIKCGAPCPEARR
ncbi:histone-like nucleoid-structuring protein Lsr2 [Streptomyces sp. NPDC053431]|uniref:Lsr2 dimerization domain-containing protein n=1 Tax=Streptomyces sp. NPDC053431 TaxID=3365703 RepID=UPI0037D31A57